MELRKILITLTAFLSLLIPGYALGGAGSGSNTSLDGTNWILESLHGQPVLQDQPITLNLEDNKVNGSACNGYFGGYIEEAGGKLRIGPVATTRMACSPHEIMVQEGQFVAALEATVAYSIVGEKLTLKDTAGQTTAIFIVQSQELKGTSWKVTGYNNGTGIISLGSTATATFRTDGSTTASAGCNTHFGGYTSAVASKTVSIGPLASTRMGCEQSLMEQENKFIAALGAAATYRIDGHRLTLYKADGATAVNLTRD